jgi:threonyl-tRNA synthetase
VQAVVVPIADRHQQYAEEVAARLGEAGLRVDVDDRREKMQAKIRDAQLRKVPYMLVVGDREAAEGTAAVRLRTNENLGPMPLGGFVEMARRLVEARSQELTEGVAVAAG